MTHGTVKRLVAGALLLAASTGCSEDDTAFIMGQMHLVTAASDAPAGYTCANLASSPSGSSSGGSSTDDFWMREDDDDSGRAVVIGTFDEVLEQRFYDREFVDRHEVDRFTVTTRQGNEYAFVYWGGDSCEPCPPGPFESLPGDPWGCDTGADAGAPPAVE